MEETIKMVCDYINQLGFPIAMVILMFLRESKLQSQWRETLKDISNSVDNNTNAVTQLCVMLKGMNGGKD